MVSVSKMSAWWMLLVILVILEGGANTITGDIPDHQDILRVEDRWKEYRNIDSVIAVADFSDYDKQKEHRREYIKQ